MKKHSSSERHTCINCHATFTGNFCNECGEKVYHENDRSFAHLFEEVVHFLTHFDGTLLTSLKTILAHPGKMSEDFCNGLRKKYFKPLSFFLLLVILYLLFPVFEGLNMKLYYYQRDVLYGGFATEQIERVKNEKHLTDEQLEEEFHHKREKTSKFLLFLLIPAMALVSKAMGFKKRKYYFDHFIFCSEASSLYILWGFLLLPLIVKITGMVGIQLFHSENTLAIAMYSVLGIYIGIGSNRFFKFKRWYSTVYALVFTFSLIYFVQYVYKLILFNIALNLV